MSIRILSKLMTSGVRILARDSGVNGLIELVQNMYFDGS